MAHTRIKIKGYTFSKDKIEDDLKGWHFLSESGLGDGEYSACGVAFDEYDIIEEKKDKGGITCRKCLELIKYYKSIKL